MIYPKKKLMAVASIPVLAVTAYLLTICSAVTLSSLVLSRDWRISRPRKAAREMMSSMMRIPQEQRVRVLISSSVSLRLNQQISLGLLALRIVILLLLICRKSLFSSYSRIRQSRKCWYWKVTITLPVKWESLNSVDFFSELSCWRKFSQRAMYLEFIILIWLGANWIIVVSLICFVYEPSPSSSSSFANSSDYFSSMCSISSISLSRSLSMFSISVRSQQMVIFLTMSWKRSVLSRGFLRIFFLNYSSSLYRYFLVPSLSSNFCNQFLILFSRILRSSSSWSQVASLISSYRLQMTAGTFSSITEKSSSFTLS